jgi:hypothetical protein
MKTFVGFVVAATLLLTYSMEQSHSWEANRFSASQEIPHILWNAKVHYRIDKCLVTCPYPEPDLVHALIPPPEDPS